MFAKYQYFRGAAVSDIYSDIKALLTGTIDKNLLSNSCDKANSTIVSTVPAGWEETTGNMYMPSVSETHSYYVGEMALVDNGTVTILPIYGTNVILRSTNEGDSWAIITIPTTFASLPNISVPSLVRNLAYGNGLWVLTNSGGSSTSIYTSSDGITWNTVSTTTPNQWGTPVWNGTIWVITTIDASQAILTSNDGITWTYRGTALPASTTWGIPVFANGLWVLTVGNISSAPAAAYLATSVDGITWATITVTSMKMWTPIYLGGLWLVCAYRQATGTMLTSPDGITWSTINLTLDTYGPPVYGNNTWVIASDGVGTTNMKYSVDGITWTSINGLSYSGPLVFFPAINKFIIATSSISAGLNNKYSADGITWYAGLSENGLSNTGRSELVVCGNLLYQFQHNSPTYRTTTDGITWNTESMDFKGRVIDTNSMILGRSNNTVFLKPYASGFITVLPILRYGKNVKTLRSLYADGVNYKKVILSLTSTGIKIIGAEEVTDSVISNICYRSEKGIESQRVDLVNGGILYIGANSRYIVIAAASSATNDFGSVSTGMCSGIFEYSRDDDWNVGSGANPYPSICFMQGAGVNNSYASRIKAGVGVDMLNDNAPLVRFPPASTFTQYALSKTGQRVPFLKDIRLSNTNVNEQSHMLGGQVLGGIKLSSRLVSEKVSIIKYNSIKYAVFYAGTGIGLAVPMI